MSGLLRRFRGFGWDGVEKRPYKAADSAAFAAIARQVLFEEAALQCELRYFEMAPGGHSTLERHHHTHGVVIFRGRGHCLLDTAVHAVEPFDLVSVPALTWHQFRATREGPFGFLCMVNRERDRGQLPTEAELSALRAVPEVARFLDGALG